MTYYLEAVVPAEDDGIPDIHVGYSLATGRWEPIDQEDREYVRVVCGLLDTYMEEEMCGEHHFGDPRIWRATAGVSSLEGRITRAPETAPLPPGAVS